MVVLVPVPVVVTPPGVLVKVHVPTAGKPLNTTDPVATAHVGCVIAPITGGGIDVAALTVTCMVSLPTALPLSVTFNSN